MNAEVAAFLQGADRWREEMAELCGIAERAGLVGALKWGRPCYAYEGKNVVIVGELKEAAVLSFFKGALLRDPQGLLERPGPNTRAARIVKFRSLDEIRAVADQLPAYLEEAIGLEKEGRELPRESAAEEFPEELEEALGSDPAFQEAFEGLTPGRQRAYLLFFKAGKKSETRVGRIAKYRKRILAGKGMNDCTCGLSKRMPNCDGSHRVLKTRT
ncbi:MAG: YdeI/OmpD-associated family protein [Verrucomicrobiales bacterium]